MNFALWLLGLFALAVGIVLAAHNPGYLILVYPPYRVEMSLTLFVALLLVLFLLGYGAVRMALSVPRLPALVRRARTQNRQGRGRSAMMDAVSAFFEGRFADAEQAAVRAMELGEQSAINSIIAARAAHELGKFDQRDQYLAAGGGKTVGESTMRLMAQTRFSPDTPAPVPPTLEPPQKDSA